MINTITLISNHFRKALYTQTFNYRKGPTNLLADCNSSELAIFLSTSFNNFYRCHSTLVYFFSLKILDVFQTCSFYNFQPVPELRNIKHWRSCGYLKLKRIKGKATRSSFIKAIFIVNANFLPVQHQTLSLFGYPGHTFFSKFILYLFAYLFFSL